jgi:hypothetical protein
MEMPQGTPSSAPTLHGDGLLDPEEARLIGTRKEKDEFVAADAEQGIARRVILFRMPRTY